MTVTDFKDDEKIEQFERTVLSEPYVVYPPIMDALGDVNGKKVLDLGCGFGNISELLLKKGAEVTGIDASQKLIDYCKRRFENQKDNFIVMDGSNMSEISEGSFDYVISSMVLLNVNTEEIIKGIFREIARVLKPDGMFVFSDLHPICKLIPQTQTERQSWGEGFSYFQNESPYDSEVLMSDGSKMHFKDMHWTLEFLTDSLAEVGMYIYRIVEPQPIEGSPEVLNDYQIPEYILFECKKL